MNLFYDPSIPGLRQLVDTAEKSLKTHNIVIDYDGEVIIDPELKYSDVKLDRYKFRTQISHAVKSNAQNLKHLFDTLITAYNGKLNKIELYGGGMRRAA